MVGSRVLKTLSVLWIVFGIVSLIAGGIELVSMIKMSLPVTAFWIPVILEILWSLVQVAAGVIGLKNWNRPEKAKICMLAAVLAIICCLVYNICMILYGFALWPIFSMIAGVAIAVVYMIGAVYNNKLNA